MAVQSSKRKGWLLSVAIGEANAIRFAKTAFESEGKHYDLLALVPGGLQELLERDGGLAGVHFVVGWRDDEPVFEDLYLK